MDQCKEKLPLFVDNKKEYLISPIRNEKGKINLHNMRAIRLEMARVYRDTRKGLISPQEATRYVYILREMLNAFVEERKHALIEDGPRELIIQWKENNKKGT